MYGEKEQSEALGIRLFIVFIDDFTVDARGNTGRGSDRAVSSRV